MSQKANQLMFSIIVQSYKTDNNTLDWHIILDVIYYFPRQRMSEHGGAYDCSLYILIWSRDLNSFLHWVCREVIASDPIPKSVFFTPLVCSLERMKMREELNCPP